MAAIQTALQKIIQKQDLTAAEMHAAMQIIMSGKATPAEISGFLVGMRMKGETVEELVAAIQVLRAAAIPVTVSDQHLIDIVGTGGDGAHTFNISTACAFVVAAAGGKVAKHGNRSVSSHSGSADVLAAAGIPLTLTPLQIAACVDQLGIGFMFAPQHHTAMQHVTAVRKELGIRTFFNLIGPLTNPAKATHQLVGVYAKEWIKPVTEILLQLGSNHALVVWAEDNLDEISINAPTHVAELQKGNIITYTLCPEQFGFNRNPLATLQVNNANESLAIIKQVLQNTPGPARDIIALNAGAALYAGNLANTIEAGVTKALDIIASGLAFAKFQAYKELTQCKYLP